MDGSGTFDVFLLPDATPGDVFGSDSPR